MPKILQSYLYFTLIFEVFSKKRESFVFKHRPRSVACHHPRFDGFYGSVNSRPRSRIKPPTHLLTINQLARFHVRDVTIECIPDGVKFRLNGACSRLARVK